MTGPNDPSPGRRRAVDAPSHPARLAQPERLQPSANLRQVASAHLLAGDAEIEITHGHAVYRLRLTSLGKLILTK